MDGVEETQLSSGQKDGEKGRKTVEIKNEKMKSAKTNK